VRVRPKVTVVAGIRTLSVSLKPLTRVEVKLQKKTGTRYVNVRAAYTSTRGTAKFTKLTKGAGCTSTPSVGATPSTRALPGFVDPSRSTYLLPYWNGSSRHVVGNEYSRT